MPVIVALDFADRCGCLFSVAHGEESAAARQVVAETGLLHDHGTAAGEVDGAAVAEGAAVGGDVVVFGNAELPARRSYVFAPGIEGDGRFTGMAQTPSAAKQLFGGHVPPRYGELERRPGAPRQVHELGKLHVLQPI